MPSKPEITKAIKKTVKEIFETDPDSLTVNHVRTIVSAQLDLDEDFLKTDPFWKNESKDLVKTEYGRLESGATEDSEVEPEAEEEEEEEEVVKPKKAPVKQAPAARGKKRQTEDTDTKSSPPKKAKTAKATPKSRAVIPYDDDSALSEEEQEEAPKKSVKPTKAMKSKSAPKVKRVVSDDLIVDSDEEETIAPKKPSTPKKATPKKPSTPKKRAPKAKAARVVSEEQILDSDEDVEMDDGDNAAPKTPTKAELKELKSSGESSLTELSDAEAKPKKKRRQSGDAKKAAPKPRAAPKKKEPVELDPSEEKIKVLKDQLAKCGIRKVWGKELKKFDTAGERIRYMQGLLKDVGMEGKFSAEKAKKIKERRELDAELSAIKAGEASWGVERASRSAGRSLVQAKDNEPAVIKGHRGLDGLEDLIDSDSDSD